MMSSDKPKFLMRGYAEMRARYAVMQAELESLRDRMRQLRIAIQRSETEQRDIQLENFYKSAVTTALQGGAKNQARISAIGQTASKFEITKTHVRRTLRARIVKKRP
jgi:chromosome segregation ATPase